MYITKEPLYGNAKAKFLMVKATNSLAGSKIFKTVLKLYEREQANIDVVFYDCYTADFFSGLDLNREQTKLFDVFSNPLNYEESCKLLLIDVLEEKFSNFKGVLCLYSFSSLLLHNDVIKVYNTFYKMLSKNPDLQILSIVYSDMHDLQEHDIINRMASTTLCIPDDEGERFLKSIVQYSTGKVKELNLEYKISDTFEFTLLTDAKLASKKVEVKQPDPTANLTFNLKLKDEEKEAKDQLQLPYMKMQTSSQSDAQILLEMEYYDEDDPDDDLDI